MGPAELGVEEIRDAAGELLNIMTGNFKSNLCDARLTCRLEPPVVKRTADFAKAAIQDAGLERMAGRVGKLVLFVTVTANPFID